MVVTPPAAKRDFTSGTLRISTTLAESFAMIGCGVALGASKAVQFDILISPAPSCASGGHSGLSGERCPVEIARTRTLPFGTCGATVELATMASGMSPATNACAAGAPPLYGTWTNFVPLL